MKNCTMGQFTGNIRQIFAYLLETYKKISPSHLNNFKREVIEINYDTVIPVDNILNKVGDLLEYRDI